MRFWWCPECYRTWDPSVEIVTLIHDRPVPVRRLDGVANVCFKRAVEVVAA